MTLPNRWYVFGALVRRTTKFVAPAGDAEVSPGKWKSRSLVMTVPMLSRKKGPEIEGAYVALRTKKMSDKKTKTPILRTGKAFVDAAPHVIKIIRATPVGRESEKVPEDVEVLQSMSSEPYSASMYAHSAGNLYSVSNWESVLRWRRMDG